MRHMCANEPDIEGCAIYLLPFKGVSILLPWKKSCQPAGSRPREDIGARSLCLWRFIWRLE
jgi:hypothetical protein